MGKSIHVAHYKSVFRLLEAGCLHGDEVSKFDYTLSSCKLNEKLSLVVEQKESLGNDK